MADFLLFLGKLNLAMGAAIIVVYLLRRPLRTQFGAPIAYAIWLLVPIAVLASLLPPRVAALPPAPLAHLQNLAGQYPAAPMTVIGQIAQPALRITGQPTGQTALVHPVIAARAAASVYGTPDYAMLLFAAWVLGAVLMAVYLARLQARFHATMRLGEAGPAVLGFFRPRVVMPDSFQEQFTAPEQAAILAHERVHLARQDARINALAALLRCLCWFNPLVHLGAASMRIDQELACDATALAGPVSRRDYANALLKSQMMVTALPLGCNWPGSQHPLIERIALLKRKRPGTTRRIAGMGLVMFAATCAGLGAWAAQPPVAAKFIAAPHGNDQIALAQPPAMNPAQGQNAGDSGPNQPVADANPISSGHPVDAAKNVPASNPISAAPSPAEMPNTGSAEAPAMAVASNDPPAAPVQPASEAPPATAVTLNDQPVAPMQPATPDPSAGPVQVAAATPASAGSGSGNAPRPKTESALRCLLGMEPEGCESIFAKAQQIAARRQMKHCAVEYTHQMTGCPRNLGPLESVTYLGTGQDLADVYDVDYLSEHTTYCILPPAPDGKMSGFLIFGNSHGGIFGPCAVISSPADPPQILYTRPQDHAALQSTSPDGAFIPAAATSSDQPVAPLPATPDPSARPVQVAAATPASAGSGPVSGVEALVNGKCQPISGNPGGATLVIGTVLSVHDDPARTGTDVVLDQIVPTAQVSAQIRDGRIVAVSNAGWFKAVTPTYVGKKVIMWDGPDPRVPGVFDAISLMLFCNPS